MHNYDKTFEHLRDEGVKVDVVDQIHTFIFHHMNEMKQKKLLKDNLLLINVIWKHIVKTNTFTH